MTKIYSITDHEDGTLSSDRDSMFWLREQVESGIKPYRDLLERIEQHPQLSSCPDLRAEIRKVVD